MTSTQETVNSADHLVVEQPTYGKQKYEYYWLGLLVLVLIFATPLFHKVYVFQTHEHFENIRLGNLSEMLIYGFPVAVLFMLYELSMHYVFDDLFFKYVIVEGKYLNIEAKKKRCYSLVKWTYTGLYYLSTSIWAYFILRETKFLPAWIGGQGYPVNMADTAPKVMEVILQMKAFYILQFGKSLGRTFTHVFVRSEGAFYEFLLHHLTTIFLILFSYLTNGWIVGVLVLLIHNYSDFSFNLGRTYVDCRYQVKSKIVEYAIYVHSIVGWCGLRIVVFIANILVPLITQWINEGDSYLLTEIQKQVMYISHGSMIFMLTVLEVMNIYWTYHIVQVAFHTIKKKSKNEKKNE